MLFRETGLSGVWLVEPELVCDERGFFGRSFCRDQFAAHGIRLDIVQTNLSFNRARGTLRGMHYQAEPFGEAKLVSCPRGAIYDVALDIRPDSPTFGRWCSAELNESSHCALYIPAGLAHGFQSLTDGALVQYQMSQQYHPDATRGVRWDDPAFAIHWPLPPIVISERDRSYPLVRGRRG